MSAFPIFESPPQHPGERGGSGPPPQCRHHPPAKPSAMARPIPRAPPVTVATFPCNDISLFSAASPELPLPLHTKVTSVASNDFGSLDIRCHRTWKDPLSQSGEDSPGPISTKVVTLAGLFCTDFFPSNGRRRLSNQGRPISSARCNATASALLFTRARASHAQDTPANSGANRTAAFCHERRMHRTH